MKFAAAALALASTSFAQNCRTKSGQVEFLRGLIAQWTLYKKQVAANTELDNEKAAQEVIRAGKEAAIEALHTEKLANLTRGTDARKLAINNEAAAAIAAINSDLNQTLTNIENKKVEKLAAIAAKLTKATGAINDKITKLNNKKTKIANNLARAQQRAHDKKNASLVRAQENHDAAVSSANATKNAKIQKHNTVLATKLAANGVALTNRLATVNQNAADEITKLEGSKKDDAATLALIDDAGTTGLAYPSDCLLDLSQVIAKVKEGKKAALIWDEIIAGN